MSDRIEFVDLPAEPWASLPLKAFERADPRPDALFYRRARLVAHIDEHARAAVTHLYRELFPDGGAVLDLMASWLSHLPPGARYRRVAGLGMNADELDNNPALTERLVHDLNAEPKLPYGDREFDACGVCVSIDYLTRPVEVLREVRRVLAPGAPLVITFSNRCFPNKVVAAWHVLDAHGQIRLVSHYLDASGPWDGVRACKATRRNMLADPLYAVIARA